MVLLHCFIFLSDQPSICHWPIHPPIPPFTCPLVPVHPCIHICLLRSLQTLSLSIPPSFPPSVGGPGGRAGRGFDGLDGPVREGVEEAVTPLQDHMLGVTRVSPHQPPPPSPPQPSQHHIPTEHTQLTPANTGCSTRSHPNTHPGKSIAAVPCGTHTLILPE